MDNVFTFWEGPQPEYITMCLRTWSIPYTLLTYDNINQYTDIDIERIKKYSLPQIADYIRVHVLRDNGGYWLDADTIMVTGVLPDTDMVGDPEERTNSIGLLHTEPGSDMFTEWANYQDEVVADDIVRERYRWDLMGNSFTDFYVLDHEDIRIHDISNYWPERYMVSANIERRLKYIEFYFNRSYTLQDIRPTDLLMLHNSWTPAWYRRLTGPEILKDNCTLSNILRAVLNES